MKTINLKSWNETEGRIRYKSTGVSSDGRKWTCYKFGYSEKPLSKNNQTKQIFTNGKWENVGGIA